MIVFCCLLACFDAVSLSFVMLWLVSVVLYWFTICVLAADLLLLVLWWCFGLDCYFVWDVGGGLGV